jgi:hypothetical protein
LITGSDPTTSALSHADVPGNAGADGEFALLLVTDDDERHVVAPMPSGALVGKMPRRFNPGGPSSADAAC